MSFAERLKEAMTEQHITQSELASKIGKGAPSVSQYLSGKSTPRAGVQQLIADTLGCTVEWLNSDGDKEEDLAEETVSPYSVSIAERDRAFAVKLKALEKKYFFSADGLFIRPAKGAGELIKEGASLNHCVATYADKYLNGQTIILFIRREAAPDESYYTMELSPQSETVIQCRGLRNCGKTPEIEEFLRKWEEWRNKKSKKKAVTAA